jgi:uncharacterized membrane protein YhhN
MMTLWLIPLAMLLLAGVLRAERQENTPGILAMKPFLSALFVAVLLLQPHPPAASFNFLFAGQIACLVGDICLIFFFQKKVFSLGLVAFLIGHVFYAVTFFGLGQMTPGGWVAALGVVLISGVIFAWLRPHLGGMLGPVMAYVLVISVMAISAFSLMGNPALPISNRAMILVGAVSFYASDIFVARHRFVQKEFANRLIGLSLYYLGQFLIAFAAGGGMLG